MNYSKPEIVLGGPALASVQSVFWKPLGYTFDAVFYFWIGTMNAYEADE